MRAWPSAALLVAAFCLVGGCVTPTSREVGDAVDPPPPRSQVVVAVIDGGISVYHERFHVSEERDRELARLGEAFDVRTTLAPSLGLPWLEARKLDDPMWRSLETGALYRIAGTNIFGAPFIERPSLNGEQVPVPIVGDDVEHGTGVSSRLVNVSPNVVLVFLQSAGGLVGEQTEDGLVQTIAPSTLAALQYAVDQPWIDIISVSLSVPGNPPDAGPASPDLQELLHLTRRAEATGKLVIFAAGNTVAPSHLAPLGGPPWVVSVGGADWHERGNDWGAAKSPDFVANYSVVEADYRTTNGSKHMGGTSVAAPAVAGRAANVVLRLREAANIAGPRLAEGPLVPANAFADGSPAIGPRELRAALNASASTWATADWDPPRDPPPASSQSIMDRAFNLSLPIAPVAAAQMGWGFVDAAEEDAAFARLIRFAQSGDASAFDPPPEKAADAAYMRASYAAREAYWGARTGGS